MKICFISRQCFFIDNKSGGHAYSESLYKIICKIVGEENVVLYFFIPENVNCELLHRPNIYYIKTTNNKIKKRFYWAAGREGYSRKQEKEIINQLESIDADCYFFDGSWLGGVSKYITKKKIVLYHNIEKKLYFKTRTLKTKLLGMFGFLSTCYNEKCITKRSNYRICLNNRDNQLLYEIYKKKADAILPIFLSDKAELQKDNKCNKRVLFVGSLYLPNVTGIRWFCKNVAPHIKYQTVIVGKNMEMLREELETDNIQVVGTVESLNEYYQAADIVIAPIFSGGGMKVKTAEALMYGKTIVGTKEAFEGYEPYMTKDMHQCTNSDEFIDVLSILYERMSSNYSLENRKLYEECFSEKYAEQVLLQAFH